MRWLVSLAAIVALLFIGLQFLRPAIAKPPVVAEIAMPPEVKQILRHSCYNCHSNETHLSWFDQPAPAYWLVAHDVRLGRQHLNFSELGNEPAAKQRATLFEAINMIQLGAMPLPSYRWAHPGARVTAEQLAVLKAYLAPFADPAQQAAIRSVTTGPVTSRPMTVQNPDTALRALPELNGLAFLPDYKNWREISTTDRGDNQTVRVILGNDVAVRAVENKQIRPWPDGAAFAKVAWKAVPDGTGGLMPGEFVQVELMVKDKTRYGSTAGWGFGRWLGPELRPYGRDAHFDRECVSCHLPVRGNDYVYTMPILRTVAQGEGQ